MDRLLPQFSLFYHESGRFQQDRGDNKVSAHTHPADGIKAHIGKKGAAVVSHRRG